MLFCSVEALEQKEWINFTICIVSGLGSLLVSIFHILICFPGYTSGSPKWTKFIPALLGTVLNVISFIAVIIIDMLAKKVSPFSNFWLEICVVLIPIFLTTFSYFSYMGDDESDSCWLRLKTWTNKKKKPEAEIDI